MTGKKGSRIVVVTGASAGVGRATAKAFGARGDRVALLARGEDGLAAAAAEVREAGGEALAIATDVADAEAVEAAAERVERELGPIDVWVNDAMATVFAPFSEIEPDEYRRSTEVTYLGCVWGTRAALRRMTPRDRGVIVQVGSALAFRGIPLQAPYCAAKHAIEGFSESLRTELLHDGSKVRVSMVHLPALNTPQFEIGRTKLPRHPQPVPPIYQPEVAAEAILWISEHRRRQLYVGGPTLKTVLGNRIAPGLVDRYLARTGYEGQQTEEPVDPGRPDNLFTPVPGDHGTHGRFDEGARTSSAVTWLSRHRGLLAGLAAAGGGVAAIAASLRR
ncbi:MAG TPA: SDR family oxidoreductase [Solirubrobacterales bacterium]|nr:SDR family oxidoreductase [Solirubrobacterales bacterium]